MRGFLAGLLIAALVLLVALLTATLGAVGVGAIGLLLHRLFDLSQWQGTLIGLAVAVSLGYMVFRLLSTPPIPTAWSGDWEEEEEEEEEEIPEPAPPIVPWRRNRPTPGTLPEKPTSKPGKTVGKGR